MGFFDAQHALVGFCSPHRKIKLPNGREIVDTITWEWHQARGALALGTNVNFIEFYELGKEVGEARESCVRRVLAHEPCPEFIFWLDDDVCPCHDAFVKLLFRARCYPDHEIFAGVYSAKNLCDPLVYCGDGRGAFWDWTIGDLLTTDAHGITGCHSGLTLVRTSLYRRMIREGVVPEGEFFYKTVREYAPHVTRTGTEDLFFCSLARKAGAKFLIDTSVLAGHIDKQTGITWGLPRESPPVKRAKFIRDKDRGEAEGNGAVLKLALDLGAGGTRREWPGHVTYTTDLRPDTEPDYCQDTLWLNLPDGHFDLVASSHHLEHLGRWDQERAWAQVFRVTKPGGFTEHVVPSIEWAAAKITAGEVDEHVLNVLYGAQEAHGYARTLNLHFMGYTKAIGRALAEGAGFVDVDVTDWRDDGQEELGYNMVITGRKPEAPAPAPEPSPEGVSS